jgi:hypothetical protein
MLIVAILATVVFGSPAAALRYSAGKYVYAEIAQRVEGVRVEGERFEVPFSLRNISFTTSNIVGVETGCGCAVANGEQLPLKIEPGEAKVLTVSIRVPNSTVDTPYTVRILVYTDCMQSPVVLSVRINEIIHQVLSSEMPSS